MPNIYDDPRQYVTPGTLSEEALAFVRLQRSTGRRVLVKAYELLPKAVCKNCQDQQVIIIVPVQSGPHKEFPGSGLATWFDGDEQSGAGWYVVHRTKKETIGPSGEMHIAWLGALVFSCPVCQPVVNEPDPVREEARSWYD